MLGVLDPATAVQLAGHPALVELWTALLDVEADATEASGDAAMALRRRARAEALRDAARRAWGDTDAGAIDADTSAPMERPES